MYNFPANNLILQELFDPDLPNSPALWAVLKGHHSGKALVDDKHDPSQCVLKTDAALSYFGYRTSQAFLDDAIAHFKKAGPVWLVWPHLTSLQPPETENAKVIKRLEYFGYDPDSDVLETLRRLLPNDHEIRTIDAQLLNRCEWRDEMEFYSGNLSKFLKYGIGLSMMRGDEIIVEAYASSLGKTRAEIGTITREAFRGQGLAPIACAYLIEACEQRGYQAYWSCDADHRASIRVAQKLGFQQERNYVIYEYEPL